MGKKKPHIANGSEPSAANIGMRLLIIGLPTLALIAIIGFMKLKSDEHMPASVLAAVKAPTSSAPTVPEDTAKAPIAIPDTTIDQTILPVIPDTLPAAPPDSVGVDERSPLTAGHEDGHLAGAYDRGAGNEYGISYDDTNTYPTPAEQHAYSDGYREGYAVGYRESKL